MAIEIGIETQNQNASPAYTIHTGFLNRFVLSVFLGTPGSLTPGAPHPSAAYPPARF